MAAIRSVMEQMVETNKTTFCNKYYHFLSSFSKKIFKDAKTRKLYVVINTISFLNKILNEENKKQYAAKYMISFLKYIIKVHLHYFNYS